MRNALAILPVVPKVVIIEKPIGPQLHAPADAPIIVPVILGPIFFAFFANLTLKMFSETTIPAMIDRIIINEKLNAVSLYTEKTMYGSRNRCSEIINNGKYSPEKTIIEFIT